MASSRSVLLPLLLLLGTAVWVSRTFVPMSAAASANAVALRGSADIAIASAADAAASSSIAVAAADPLWWLPITLGLGVFTAISTFGLFWFLTDGFDPDRRDTGRR
eukprot:CAMPEP_0178451750 /NCGR_PEP_ID=MMETSP0689_2-20121128/43860_1 /TAXON_ID=160604 /ORGANISM="Amphidinium massartii, Strain CS-259" /LENGTH=105 /DNA_ID=CAMNT_0020077375 /DNA_START=58 /DNA_END=375 /DNA_ORIENTATION=+